MTIAYNIGQIRDEIGEAAVRSGRHLSDITIVAVTKTRGVDEIAEAAWSGIVHFGENRVQEAAEKIPSVSDEIVWHMVGPLQSNKAKQAVTLFDWVDSIHSEKIVDVLSGRAEEADRILRVLIQVNISGEDTKSGVLPGQARSLAAHAMEKKELEVSGLMTIGSFGVAPDVTRSEFARMKELFDQLREDPVVGSAMQVLSMGMSGDYRIAVEEGATMVRIGTAIFGERN